MNACCLVRFDVVVIVVVVAAVFVVVAVFVVAGVVVVIVEMTAPYAWPFGIPGKPA